jgi:phosphate transport system substrate-binding protein
MRSCRIALLATAFAVNLSSLVRADDQISGAGATFPLPFYAAFAEKYRLQTDRAIPYHGLGSGAGIRHLLDGKFAFAGSDWPLSSSERDRLDLAQFPTTTGAVVVAYNIPGIKSGELKLDQPAIRGIYSRNIRYWDDEYLSALNPRLDLPHIPIRPYHRSDASGTTFHLNRYLNLDHQLYLSVDQSDADSADPGNERVAGRVQKVKGAIGY